MDLRDLIVTPILLIAVYLIAYFIRPFVTTPITRPYFIPALSVRIFGALALGFVYQFYYSGGDTFNYHTHGSRIIWEAIMNHPDQGFGLLFNPGDGLSAYRYSSKILFFGDPNSYFVVQIAALFDLITFSTYSATATLFAILSFIGSWLMFNVFVKYSANLRRWFAIATLFIPSVIFWGSGILKDSVVLSCLGILTYGIMKIFIERQFKLLLILGSIVATLIIYKVKIYVLLCFFPAALLWIYSTEFSRIRSLVLRILILPFVIALAVGSAYFAVVKVSEDDKRYSLNNISRTARITAYDIGFYTGKNAGSGYSLGELDDSFGSMIKLAPAAINVSLFRPYLWEVQNPLMLLSSLESTFLLLLTLWVLVRKRQYFFRALVNPLVLFCFTFSIAFAFAVGVSTFNFGTLARYKIPLLPFYLLSLILIAAFERKKDYHQEPIEPDYSLAEK